MKRVLALTAVLCFAASMSSASIFRCWLVPGAVDSSGFYSVQVYGQVLADPAVPGESLTDSGLSDFAITVYTPGTVNISVPKTNPMGTAGVISFADTPWATMGTTGSPAAQDFDHDGDKDDVEFPVADPDGWVITIGTTGPVLLATETWKHVAGAYGTVTLTPYIADTSRHWNPDYSRSLFTKYENVSTTITFAAPVTKPTINLTTDSNRINTTTRGGLTATGVGFTATLVSGDNSTSGNIAGQAFTTLPATKNVDLTITNGTTSQDIQVDASATNDGGTGTASTTVTVLVAPKIVVKVNGAEATPGQVFSTPEFWGNNTVDLSLADSQGFIQTFSIVNPTTGLNWSGSTWSGNSYDLYGPGVTFTILNDGSGLNSDTMTVQFVPEPATLALLAIGGIGAIIRRRK